MKYIQVFLESLIPLFGFFLWDWNLYFILLYYFLDLIADEVIMYFKTKAINAVNPSQNKITYPVLSAMVLILGVYLIHLAMIRIHPEIDFKNEVIRFWTYKELGVQQGYLLFPLIALAAYQNYRTGFLLSGKVKKVTQEYLWREHIKAGILIIGSSGLIFSLSFLFVFEEIYYVLTIVAGIAVYKLFWNND